MSATLVGEVERRAGEGRLRGGRRRGRALDLVGERAGDGEDGHDDADRQGAEEDEKKFERRLMEASRRRFDKTL